MIHRRSILGGMLSAPFVPKTQPPVNTLGMWAPDTAIPGPSVAETFDRVDNARQRLEAVKLRAQGPQYPITQVHHIESRRATSPAIKAILIRDYQRRHELVDAEFALAKAIWEQNVPEWVRRFW